MNSSLYINAINYLSISNPSNHLPYHSIDHLWFVYNSCREIISTFQNNVEIKERELLIAALFHDYDHSGGKLKDSENIVNAILGVQLFHQANPVFDLEYVKYLITCTEFPYVISDEELSLEAKILRDADLSYVFDDISIVKLYTGLRKEFNQNLFEFLNNQYNFLSSLKFYTKYFQNKWELSIRQKRLDELEALKTHV